MADAYQSMYLEEGLFGKKKSPASPEELPSYKKLQTAISDRKKLGDHLNANPWQAAPSERKYVAREDTDLDFLVDYLLSEGYADDEDSAVSVLGCMSESWYDSIMEKMSEEDSRKKAFDMVRSDIVKKHGEDSLITGSSKKEKKSTPPAHKRSGDSESDYKKTYGKNKSFWE